MDDPPPFDTCAAGSQSGLARYANRSTSPRRCAERGEHSSPLSASGLVTARRTCGLLPEAVAAVHWAIASGLEGDLGLLATLGADGGVHLSRGLTIAAAVAAAFVAARLTAGRTGLGLVGEALFGAIGLIGAA